MWHLELPEMKAKVVVVALLTFLINIDLDPCNQQFIALSRSASKCLLTLTQDVSLHVIFKWWVSVGSLSAISSFRLADRVLLCLRCMVRAVF